MHVSFAATTYGTKPPGSSVHHLHHNPAPSLRQGQRHHAEKPVLGGPRPCSPCPPGTRGGSPCSPATATLPRGVWIQRHPRPRVPSSTPTPSIPAATRRHLPFPDRPVLQAGPRGGGPAGGTQSRLVPRRRDGRKEWQLAADGCKRYHRLLDAEAIQKDVVLHQTLPGLHRSIMSGYL